MATENECIGWVLLISLFLGYAIGQSVRVFIDLYLTWWASFSQSSYTDEIETIPDIVSGLDEQSEWILVLGMLVIFNFIFASIRSYASVELSVRSSRLLFVQVLHRVLKAPLSFYQENPVGRLLNRMSGDMDRGEWGHG
mmetsp:Transcript_11709/g.13550  ORF Transcript_11709/g.13550 Transcript_11709/m.13550 type:complete len:139 (+) Transcript_11709:231-647(+)